MARNIFLQMVNTIPNINDKVFAVIVQICTIKNFSVIGIRETMRLSNDLITEPLAQPHEPNLLPAVLLDPGAVPRDHEQVIAP